MLQLDEAAQIRVQLPTQDYKSIIPPHIIIRGHFRPPIRAPWPTRPCFQTGRGQTLCDIYTPRCTYQYNMAEGTGHFHLWTLECSQIARYSGIGVQCSCSFTAHYMNAIEVINLFDYHTCASIYLDILFTRRFLFRKQSQRKKEILQIVL